MGMKIWNFIDERKIVERFLKNKNLINEDPFQILIVYIKHLKSVGKNKIEIRSAIDKMMEEYYKSFVYVDWDNVITKLVNKYTKPQYREFKTLKDIKITKQELEFIKNQNHLEKEKLLFILLVLAKGGIREDKTELWINVESRILFKLAQYKLHRVMGTSTFQQREKVLYELGQEGLISFPKYITATGIKIEFANSDINEGDIGLVLSLDQDNIEDVVLEYLLWKGDQGIIKCQNCSRLVKPRNKKAKTKTKYCEECAKEIKNQQNKSYYKK